MNSPTLLAGTSRVLEHDHAAVVFDGFRDEFVGDGMARPTVVEEGDSASQLG